MFILYQCIFIIIYVVLILVVVAFFTLFERKLIASFQRRVGPQVVGFLGILQPAVDGLKVILKEQSHSKNSKVFFLFLGPFLAFIF